MLMINYITNAYALKIIVMQELALILRTHATCGKEFHFGTFMEAVRGTVGLHDYNISIVISMLVMKIILPNTRVLHSSC